MKYSQPLVRCYESHPVLELGGGKFIGGSCLHPMSAEADIYIGFERSMAVTNGNLFAGGPQHISYPIPDRMAPEDAESFKALVLYIKQALAQGKTVHAGCIGGHGRTGTFLAALVKEVRGEEDAITWVRTNYCKKAVESTAQVQFLAEHFGIKEVAGSDARHHQPSSSKKSHPQQTWMYGESSVAKGAHELPPPTPSGLAFKGHTRFDPIKSPRQLTLAGIL